MYILEWIKFLAAFFPFSFKWTPPNSPQSSYTTPWQCKLQFMRYLFSVCQGANGHRVRPYWMSGALDSLGRELAFGEQSAKDFEINLEVAVTDTVVHFTVFGLQKPSDVFKLPYKRPGTLWYWRSLLELHSNILPCMTNIDAFTKGQLSLHLNGCVYIACSVGRFQSGFCPTC